jgi:uncharacterized membrane protein
MATLFELLFKYRPHLFGRGTLALRAAWPWYAICLLSLGIILGSYLIYRYTEAKIENRWKIIFAALRAFSLFILLLIFLQPVLVLQSVIPQKSFVAILYDLSKSMEIRDGAGGQSRLDLEKALLRSSGNPWLEQLAAKFKIRYFRFAQDVRRAQGFEEVKPHGELTDLEKALNQVVVEMGNAPIAGIILITDGADNHSRNLFATAAQLHSKRIPIYPIGIGSPQFDPDIELVRLSAPTKVLRDTMIEAEVSVHASGYTGRPAKLVVLEQNKPVHSQEIRLGSDAEIKTHRVFFNTGSAGVKLFRFLVEPFPDEGISLNNDAIALVHVTDEQPRVLYLEGEPRWSYGFLRRAISDDKSLHLVTLLRQADGKYLRQGIESPSELEKGFPVNPAELNSYKAMILGSIEASFFSFDQLRMISEFVGRRGGGLAMLGGRNAFGQGGYVNTPLEEVLPVIIRQGQGSIDRLQFQDQEFKARITGYGLQHPVMRLSAVEAETAKRWNGAPELVGFNPTAGAKPGATILALAAASDAHGPLPILIASQRYGEGKSLAVTTGSIWRWRMGLDHRDNLHDLFWRQMLRWLVSDVPDAVSASSEKHSYSRDDLAIIRAEVRDESFFRINNARVLAQIKSPSGKVSEIPLEWDVSHDGEYSGTFKPLEDGLHEVSVQATLGSRSLGGSKIYFRIAESSAEYHNATLNSDLLKRLAEETEGRSYTPDSLRTLPEDISYVENGPSRVEQRELWDMPILYLVLAGTVLAEWALRKKKGLA